MPGTPPTPDKPDTPDIPDIPGTHTPDKPDTAADIARRVAHELHQLSQVTARVECAVSGLILSNPMNSINAASGLHRDLQSLDSLGQMLDALAQFLTDMAAQIPPQWTFDPTSAASALKLKDLANRLANQNQSQTHKQNDDCDFF